MEPTMADSVMSDLDEILNEVEADLPEGVGAGWETEVIRAYLLGRDLPPEVRKEVLRRHGLEDYG